MSGAIETNIQPGSLFALDKRISNRVFSQGSCIPRWVFKLFEYGGDGIVWLGITLSALLLPSTSMTARAVWANFLLGIVVDLILVGTIKGIFRRKRPVYNKQEDFVVVVAVDNYSFPSGHSSRASYVAVFALVFLPALAPPLQLAIILWAFLTALSRAAMGRHYAGDVFAGILVGVLNVALLTKGHFLCGSAWIDEQTAEDAYALVRSQLQKLSTAP